MSPNTGCLGRLDCLEQAAKHVLFGVFGVFGNPNQTTKHPLSTEKVFGCLVSPHTPLPERQRTPSERVAKHPNALRAGVWLALSLKKD